MSDTEKAVLGVILNQPELLHSARAMGLSDDHFGSLRHKKIWRAMVGMANSSSPIDMITMKAWLEAEGSLELVGGAGYLSQLDLDMPDPSNMEAYVDAVKASAVRRKVIDVGKSLTRVPDGSYSTNELLEQVHKNVQEVVDLADTGAIITSGEDAINDLVERLEDGVDLGIKSGYDGLDLKLGGMRAGNLIIIAGRPGMGKTAFALNMSSVQMCMNPGKRVAVFSLEMSSEELVSRLLSSESGVPLGKIRMGAIGDNDWRAIAKARTRIAQFPLFIEDSGGITLQQLISKARELHNVHGLDIIYVDYLQLMGSGMKAENRTQELSQITRGLKMLAKDLRIPVVALSQLSREVERRNNKRPQLADLRESGSIEQDADAVAFLYRPGYYKTVDNTNGLTELILAKNRSGPPGTINLIWEPNVGRFLNP